MYLCAESWRLRQAAREAARAGEFERGWVLAMQAQDALETRSGAALRLLCEWSLLVDERPRALTVAAPREVAEAISNPPAPPTSQSDDPARSSTF